jgi:hypothetical protein
VGILRSARCSNCGRDVRGLEDARKIGGRWYCSQSCVLQAEASGSRSSARRSEGKSRGPLRTIRSFVKWSLIVLALLGVLAVVLAIVGVGSEDKAAHARDRSSRVAKRVRAPRSRLVRVGHATRVSGNWRMAVTAFVPNADSVIANHVDPYLDVKQGSPHVGAQYVIVGVSARYCGALDWKVGEIAEAANPLGRYRPQLLSTYVCVE